MDERKFYWAEKDLHTQFGAIKENKIKKAKPGKIRTHLNNEMLVLEALSNDNMEKIKRGPAIMLPKDIGLILNSKSFIL